jgi:hypothetical protein
LPGSAVAEFASSQRGELLHAGHDDYNAARAVWNGMIDKRPALIARCHGTADVVTAVNFARRHNLLLAVRGGGHNVAGNAVCDGGLVIDLSLMKSIRVDSAQRTARAEGGATWGDFDRETQTFGLATTGGIVSTTGVAGLTLGGGLGWLSRKYGLTCDNLLSADVVTADGRLLTASNQENQDLFWGLRGGGGNFGIVTSLEFRLHPVGPTVVGGMVAHPIEKAKELLTFYHQFTSTEPDELTTYAGLVPSPDGSPIAAIIACYKGPIAEGQRVVQPLKEFGPPVMDQLGPMPYIEVQRMLDDLFQPGFQHYWKSSFLQDLSAEAFDTMVHYHANRPSPLCHVVIEELGGMVSRIDSDETAFAHRDKRYSLLIVGMSPNPAEAGIIRQWTREFWEAMQPFSSAGVYVNYLGQEADEGADRVKAAYGSEKYERLVVLKNNYDPTNLFRLNQNILPNA